MIHVWANMRENVVRFVFSQILNVLFINDIFDVKFFYLKVQKQKPLCYLNLRTNNISR